MNSEKRLYLPLFGSKPQGEDLRLLFAEIEDFYVNLLNDIKENGQLAAITIKEDYTIISGHRRCAVLKELGIEITPAVKKYYKKFL